MGQMMDQAKQFPASQPEPTKAPPPASNERPRLRRSAAVREYITRMVAGMLGWFSRTRKGTISVSRPAARNIRATAILKLSDLPPDPTDDRVYDLNPLLKRGFQFVYDAASGIESVAVKKLRLSSMAVKGDRITLEADANARCEAIYDLLDEVGKSVRLRTFNVSQVELAALVATKSDEKPKSVTARITYPNSCSLKYDDVDLKLREMLVDSGIEPREPTESMKLAEMETAEA
jgi:hypothetical protein